jgi:hypothetical protein
MLLNLSGCFIIETELFSFVFVFVYLVEQEFDDSLVRIRLSIMQGRVAISVFPKKISKLFLLASQLI